MPLSHIKLFMYYGFEDARQIVASLAQRTLWPRQISPTSSHVRGVVLLHEGESGMSSQIPLLYWQQCFVHCGLRHRRAIENQIDVVFRDARRTQACNHSRSCQTLWLNPNRRNQMPAISICWGNKQHTIILVLWHTVERQLLLTVSKTHVNVVFAGQTFYDLGIAWPLDTPKSGQVELPRCPFTWTPRAFLSLSR